MDTVKMDVVAQNNSNNNNKDVDESLYSRQLYVFGHEAQKKLASSNILLVGLNGLGVEVAKNIILAGVASVTLYDNTLVTYQDLSAQFYLTEQDLGKPRSTTSGKKLMELNPYVDVTIHTADPLTTDIISQHSVVILIDQSWETQCQIAEYCHLKNIAVLIGDVKGVFGSIFCDFGKDFIVSDSTGEESVTCVIGNIILDPTATTANSSTNANANASNDTNQVIISVLEENRHNLEVGDTILLHGLYNSDGSEHVLNNTQTTVLSIKDSYAFTANVSALNIAAPAVNDMIVSNSNNSSGGMNITSAASINIHHEQSSQLLQQQLYSSGGYITPVKTSVTLHFKSLTESVNDANINFNCDVMKMESAPILHLAWRTLYKYKEQSIDNSLPQPGNTAHAQAFYDLAVSLNHTALTAANGGTSSGVWTVNEVEIKNKTNENLLKRFALCCRGVVSPMCALIGGILGQEVLKASSGKFTPIQQWYYYNGIDALSEQPLPVEEVTPTTSTSMSDGSDIDRRYDGQVMVWGKTVQQKLSVTNAFLVGAGAIGCEMLKNWAMMGMSAGGGTTYVTDMDNIERSNLSRQFLFRNSDINQLKSVTAVKAIHATMNQNFHCVAYDDKVGVETEDKFGDDYFDKLDIVCAALDNVEARLYLDQRCLLYHKPMFESGTLGTKGHTQVVIPHKTEHYGATRDPPEKSIPLCTLKSFPNKIEHTLQWAREWFEEIFKQTPDHVNRYVSDIQEFKNHLQSQSNTKLDTLQKLQEFFQTTPKNYLDCIQWARCVHEDLFVNKIQQLLYMLPIDKIGADGTPFWSGAKLPPSIIPFDVNDVLHREFLVALADLRATVYQLPPSTTSTTTSNIIDDVPTLSAMLVNVTLPVFQPNSNMKISLTEEEAAAEKNKQQSSSSNTTSNSNSSSNEISSSEYMDVDSACDALWRSLPTVDSLNNSSSVMSGSSSNSGLYRVKAIDFDKDIDSHMRVVAALANMRARNYRIPGADLHKARGIAGKIIPAIATTTAMVTGMICMEMMKYIQNHDTPVEKYQNTFTNLALPLFTSAEPDPPKAQVTVVKGKEWKWNQWDRVEINDNYNMTLLQLIQYIEDKFEAELAMLSAGVSILYSSFSNPKKAAERKNMTLRAVYESVTKKIIPPSQKYLIFELILNDMDSGEEMEVPYLRLKLRD